MNQYQFTLPQSAFDFVRLESGFLLREDVFAWTAWQSTSEWYRHGNPSPEDLEFHTSKLFWTFPEFRSLFDYRVKHQTDLNGLAPHHRRATDLYIATPVIGLRFRIQHGHGTYILAREIGSDFWVNHLVTIGSHRGIPKIGNRVQVRTGAVVVGPITIGDDVKIFRRAGMTCCKH